MLVSQTSFMSRTVNKSKFKLLYFQNKATLPSWKPASRYISKMSLRDEAKYGKVSLLLNFSFFMTSREKPTKHLQGTNGKFSTVCAHLTSQRPCWRNKRIFWELNCFDAKSFFCFNKPIWQLVTWAKPSFAKLLWNIGTQCVLELFCEMLIDKTGRSEKMVEWWVIYLCVLSFLLWCWRSMSKMLLLLLYYCLVFLSVRFILSLICIKQTVIHPAFSETRDSLISQKSIFNILSIIRTLANTISIQSLKTPKIYAHMPIQFQDQVKKYSQTDEPPNTSQYTRLQITKQRWTNRTDNEYRYYSRNDQFSDFQVLNAVYFGQQKWPDLNKRSHFSVGPSADNVCEK